MFHLTSTAEIDDADQCFDDIIGQSLMLAHNAVQSSPEQLLTGSLDWLLPACDPVDDVCIRSCDQPRSHDQLMNLYEVICLDSNGVANTTHSSNTHEVAKPPPAVAVATNMPSEMSFIDWTDKNVTPSDYLSTPTRVYVTVGRDSRNPVNPVMSSKKKKKTNKTNTKPTVSFHKYLLFAVRVYNCQMP